MKKTGNMLWGIVFIALGLIWGLNALGITNINVFFRGWWTLFIIIPSLIGVIKEGRNTWNYIWLFIGIVLLLSAQGILNLDKVSGLIIPGILIILGLSFILRDTLKGKVIEKVKELNKEENEEYYATFSGQKLNFVQRDFKGAKLNAVFGGLDLNLKDAIIEQDKAISATAVFGGIDIIVPSNVNVEVISNSIFGGVSNKATDRKENAPTIYIKAFCLFGGVEIK
ncbi:MAG: cell wall-active antibiotics response protein [Clostridia bacterium]|jgi:predicted membrane protein|nr:cell wall-active antibiotics response protein [Clostridia bacterium]